MQECNVITEHELIYMCIFNSKNQGVPNFVERLYLPQDLVMTGK